MEEREKIQKDAKEATKDGIPLAIQRIASVNGISQISQISHVERATTRMNKARMLESLEKTHGIVSYAAKMAGISRRTHELWVKKDAIYRDKAARFREDALDMAESVVQTSMSMVREKPELALKAASFYLENRGRERGYGQKPGMNVQTNVQVNAPTISIEQFREIARKALVRDDGR